MAQSDFLFDVLVRQQTQLEGLKAQHIDEFDEVIGKIRDTVASLLTDAGVERIADLDGARLLLLIDTIREEVRKFLEEHAESFTTRLEEAANHESEFLLNAIILSVVDIASLKVPGSDAAWKFATTSPVPATGQLLSDYLQAWTERGPDAFESLLRNASAQGWTLQQTLTAIQGTKAANYTDGLLGKLFRDGSAVIRTAVQHASNTARASVYQTNSSTETADGGFLLLGYRWISVLDNRTTLICRSLDGRVFRVGEGPLPPMHILCRSTTMPEFKDSVKLLENSTRPSMFGPVRANLTYYQWLSLQPAWFQDSILGPSRGKLFRNGGLSAEEFARLNLGRTFEPLTLEEMKRRWPQIFEQAGL